MRIALLTPFYPYRGGIAQFSDRLYQELILDNEVEVFSYSTLYPKIFFPGKSQFVPNPIDESGLVSQRILSSINPLSFGKTARAINKYKPDVLLVAYWMPHLAFALSGVCKRLLPEIKVVGLVHNAKPHEKSKLDKSLASLFLKQCDGFVTMSEHVKEDLLRMKVKGSVLALEHPIYDQYLEKTDRATACVKLGIDANKKCLLFFGLIRSYKGLDLLIEAMSLLDDSYQLVIAGECYGSFSSYEQLISLSKNKNNIKVFEHYISDEMVSTLFSVADVLVLPYRSATQSGVVAIAYQMETPMIATDVGSLGIAIRDSNTGLVVPEVSAESLSKGILQFFGGEYKTEYIENLKIEKARLSWSSFTKSIKPFISRL